LRLEEGKKKTNSLLNINMKYALKIINSKKATTNNKENSPVPQHRH
jgi:hypothetical protein